MHSSTLRAFGVVVALTPLVFIAACGSEAKSTDSVAQPVVVAPTVTVSASPMSVTSGGSSTITWSTTNATGCTASGGWTGAKATNGSASTGNLTTNTLFSLTCAGEGGTSGYGAVTISVTAATPAPTVTLTANPTSVASGATSTLTWSSTNATSCTASNGWTGTKAVSGTQSTGTLTANTTYALMCTGAGGSASANATVTVTAGGGNVAPTANAGPDQTVASAASVQLNGTGTDTDGTIASYRWTQTMGTAVTLSSMTVRNPTFTAPTVTTDTTLRFSLTVTDNAGATSTADTVDVVVQAPVAQQPPPSQPLGYYTDLASAPVGAKVTAYGTGFGSTGTVTLGGTTQTVVSYSDTKVVFTVSGAGGALMVGGKSLGNLPVHMGRLLEATPSTFNQSFWAGVQPGDVVTLRAGTYTQSFGEGTWYFAMGETYKKGTATQPIAVVAAPGEAVTISSSSRPPLMFGNGTQNSQHAEWLTFAGFAIRASESCVSGGGDTTQPSGGPDESGGRFIRLVAIDCTITDASTNTMTGLFDVNSDGWKVLGNTFHDPANRVVINNNHIVYVNGGADDVEVAYNNFIGVHVGHVVQVHQDGTPKLYERVYIHDNVFTGTNYGDMRGVSVVNVDNASTVTIERNTFRHQGQNGWGCINIYRGQVTVNANDCRDSQGGLNLNNGYQGARHVTATNNAFCPVAGFDAVLLEGVSASDLTLTGAQSCN